MKIAPYPQNEAERISALQAFDVLDTAPEIQFDDLVAIAAQICGVPIALISLVDTERQWFKAAVGVRETQTPRDIAICSHSILQDEIFEIEDLADDIRFADNPLVASTYKMRFYAGAQLTTEQGLSLGTLCVIDTQPRRLSDGQRDALRRLARQVMSQLALRQAIKAARVAQQHADEVQHRLNHFSHRFSQTFEHAAVPMLFANAYAVIEDVNPSFAALLGYTRDELIGTDGWQLVHPEDRAGYQASFAQINLQQTDTYVSERRLIHRDGHAVSVQANVSALRDADGGFTTFTIVEDITERLQSQAKQRELTSALRESDRRKDHFLAMLGHELRNPLAPITTALGIMQLVDKDGSGPATRARIIIERQAAHLKRLVDDLLDVSRVTQGKIVLNQTDILLDDVLQRAVETAEPLIDQRHHTLHVVNSGNGIMLTGDIVRLVQVFGNLLNNAAKYTPDGGSIWLDVQQNRFGVEVTVSDSGIGISSENMATIFDLFSQADNSYARTAGGLGLGLTLARTLIELHGGSIHASSEGLGRGASFSVRLPLHEATQPVGSDELADYLAGNGTRLAHPSQDDASHPRLKVLLIDDNLDAIESTRVLLAMFGYAVSTCTDGARGVAMARSWRPDVVLCDIGMPGMNGYQVVKALYEIWHVDDPAMPYIIAVTGYGQGSDQKQALDAGFHCHMTKPVHAETLQIALESVAKQRQLHNQADIPTI